ncbi:MAG TPA: NADH-quinone oxidoreductase subunit NuoH [Actinomycetota bacterium]|nr:NADH-quinone oxidoreductase subunit NuoH [Actinomycetota bacterium]
MASAQAVLGTLAASQSFVNQWFSNEWVALVVKVIVVMVFVLVAPLGIGYMEHKVLAHMQARLGPMDAGRFHGWAQLIADGVKFVQKEDVVPRAADSLVFTLAPAVALVPYIAIFIVLPFGNTVWAENLDIGIFYVLAIGSVSVIGILMAGWASANKFALIGALRAAAQLIAYELPLVLAAVAVVMQAGTMSLVGIVEAQRPYWYVLTQPIMAFIFLVASLAELTRPPFDMPIADSEIIFGAYTEYTGLKFAFFLLSEYAGIVALSGIAAVLFLGGYLPLPFLSFIPGPLWMFAKIGALSFVVIWFRATYPRLREDQLQRFSWVVLVPLALADILVTAVVKVAVK